MKNRNVGAILLALIMIFGGPACGNNEEDNGNDGTENSDDSGSATPTVSEEEYVDACMNHAVECDGLEIEASDCEDQWDFDLEHATYAGSCVDARTEGWDCIVEHDCGNEPGCQEVFGAIGPNCAPE